MNPAPLETWHAARLKTAAKALEANNFRVHLAADAADAQRIIFETIIPEVSASLTAPAVVGFGGSMSCAGLVEEFRGRGRRGELAILDTVDYAVPREEQMDRRRRALLADIFVTGTNALTLDGRLVNLDNLGNRVGALHFGPRAVVVLAGRNKLADSLDAAMARVKSVAAPANAMRLERKTPCVKTGRCHDCQSPERICSVWTITEKCSPPGRIQVILANQDLGL